MLQCEAVEPAKGGAGPSRTRAGPNRSGEIPAVRLQKSLLPIDVLRRRLDGSALDDNKTFDFCPSRNRPPCDSPDLEDTRCPTPSRLASSRFRPPHAAFWWFSA